MCLDYAKNEIEKVKDSSKELLFTLREKNQNFKIFKQELFIEKIHKDRSLKVGFIMALICNQ